MTTMVARLSLREITKRYPAVIANDGVSLDVAPGEIHAVLGENGAGKSTLMKIIYGAVRPDDGEIRWNGHPTSVRNPREARALGISMVFQHFSLFDTVTAAENVWLGLDRASSLASVTQRIRSVAVEYGLEIDPTRPVYSLSVGERQLMAAISGEDRRAPSGSIALFGADVAADSPRVRRRAGMHFVPEERLGRGAVPTLSLAQNTLLTRTGAVGRLGLLSLTSTVHLASHLIRK